MIEEFDLEATLAEWADMLDDIPLEENGKMPRHTVKIALRVGILIHRVHDLTEALKEARK